MDELGARKDRAQPEWPGVEEGAGGSRREQEEARGGCERKREEKGGRVRREREEGARGSGGRKREEGTGGSRRKKRKEGAGGNRMRKEETVGRGKAWPSSLTAATQSLIMHLTAPPWDSQVAGARGTQL